MPTTNDEYRVEALRGRPDTSSLAFSVTPFPSMRLTEAIVAPFEAIRRLVRRNSSRAGACWSATRRSGHRPSDQASRSPDFSRSKARRANASSDRRDGVFAGSPTNVSRTANAPFGSPWSPFRSERTRRRRR